MNNSDPSVAPVQLKTVGHPIDLVVCAWCKSVIKDFRVDKAAECRTSHGICLPCKEKNLSRGGGMNAEDIPAKLIDSKVVEIFPDGTRDVLGLFTRRSIAEQCLAHLRNLSPSKLFEIEPMHPEFPAWRSSV